MTKRRLLPGAGRGLLLDQTEGRPRILNHRQRLFPEDGLPFGFKNVPEFQTNLHDFLRARLITPIPGVREAGPSEGKTGQKPEKLRWAQASDRIG